MKKLTKIFKHTIRFLGVIFLVGLLLITFGINENRKHVKLSFISYYGFIENNNLHYRENIPDNTKELFIKHVNQAELNIVNFFGDKRSNPRIIYFDKKEDVEEFSLNPYSPAATEFKFYQSILLKPKAMINSNTISHELCHAELNKRFGLSNAILIPTWFQEGFASQFDLFKGNKEICSDYNLNNQYYKNIKALDSLDFIYTQYNLNEVHQNYTKAKLAVSLWYTPDRLTKLIKLLDETKDFNSSYYTTFHK